MKIGYMPYVTRARLQGRFRVPAARPRPAEATTGQLPQGLCAPGSASVPPEGHHAAMQALAAHGHDEVVRLLADSPLSKVAEPIKVPALM